MARPADGALAYASGGCAVIAAHARDTRRLPREAVRAYIAGNGATATDASVASWTRCTPTPIGGSKVALVAERPIDVVNEHTHIVEQAAHAVPHVHTGVSA